MSAPSNLSRRQFVAFSGTAALASGLGIEAHASDYPNRTIRLVVPYSAGGGSDMIARTVAQKMTETLGWSVVVDNRAGANGMIGTDMVAKSPADGYTVLLADTGHATNAALQPKLPFDPVKDFAPLTLVGSSPQLLVAHPAFPANTLAELIALPRDQVKTYGVGTTGQGSAPHLLLETLKLRTGMDLVHVPYKGGAAALTDAVGGQVPMVMNSIPACMPHIEAKRLKVLAVASPARHPKLPRVQTFSEVVPGVVGSAWYGFLAPARTPQAIQDQLAAAFDKILEGADVKTKLDTSFIDPMPRGPQAFAKFLAEDLARWQSVTRQTGITMNS